MAEIISRKKGGKKIMPRVDLTPMVDLGFLLITFFIVTTSMTKPSAIDFKSPANGTANTTAESKTLNLVLADNNEVHYYLGNDSLHYQTCNYGTENNLRKVIIQHQLLVEKKFGNKLETVVLIKPTQLSNYKNIVATLDEMLICKVSRYMLVNTSNFEESLMKN